MRIVVVGLGKVGRALTAQLTAENNDIVVIDQNPDLIEDIVNIYDVRGLVGNGGCYDVQKEAFEDGADLLIATTSSDESNILACLVAKKLGTQHTIARIRNPEYEKQLRFMRDDLGLSMFVNPEKATAREIARVLRFPVGHQARAVLPPAVRADRVPPGRRQPAGGPAAVGPVPQHPGQNSDLRRRPRQRDHHPHRLDHACGPGIRFT